jgi:hypothetical protein
MSKADLHANQTPMDSNQPVVARADAQRENCLGDGALNLTNEQPSQCVLQTLFRLYRDRWTQGVKDQTDEQYVANFCDIARRTLSDAEHRLFRFHFLLGADWKLCARKLKLDRGDFLRMVHSIESKLIKSLRNGGRSDLESSPSMPRRGVKGVLLAKQQANAV